MFPKNQLLSEKCQSIESEMFCRNVPILTSLLTKLTSSLPLLFFTHPPSFSDALWRTATQLRSPGLLNFRDICLSELLPTFYAQETYFHQQWEEFIGQGFQSCYHSVQSPSLGWAPGHPASHHPEWSARNPVFPLLSLATGLGLVTSHGPAMWPLQLGEPISQKVQ